MNAIDIRARLETAMEKLLAYASEDSKRCEAALAEFLGDADSLDEAQSQSFFAFLCQGHEDESGERLIDRYIRESGATISSGEEDALRALQASWFSLFEVQEVRTGESFILEDVIGGGSIDVEESGATKEISRFDLLLAWILPGDDESNLLGVGTLVPRVHREPVTRAMLAALEEARRAQPGRETPVLLRRISGFAQAALTEAYQGFRPRLVTTDGDDVLFCSAHYRVEESESVARILEGDPRMETPATGIYLWLRREASAARAGERKPPRKDRKAAHLGDKKDANDEHRLGTIRLTGRNLVLESNSRVRLERGKALLAELLGDKVEHAMDRLQDPWQAIAEQAEAGPRARDATETRKIALEAKRRLEAWMDERLPALGDKTPRQAAKTTRGRVAVTELLKDQENHFARIAGDGVVDFKPVYKQLGIQRR